VKTIFANLSLNEKKVNLVFIIVFGIKILVSWKLKSNDDMITSKSLDLERGLLWNI
jgi:hypothetical protein